MLYTRKNLSPFRLPFQPPPRTHIHSAPTHAHSLGIPYTRIGGKFNENCLCDFWASPLISVFRALYSQKRFEQEIVNFTHNQWCQFREVAEECSQDFPTPGNANGKRGLSGWAHTNLCAKWEKKFWCVHTIDCNSIKARERETKVPYEYVCGRVSSAIVLLTGECLVSFDVGQ